jgi:hypothetical protein
MTISSAGLASSACFAGLSVSSKSSRGRSLSTLLETSPRALAWVRGVVSFGVALLLLGAACIPAQAQTLPPNWYQQWPATNPGGHVVEG